MVWQPAEGGTAVSATEWSQGAEGVEGPAPDAVAPTGETAERAGETAEPAVETAEPAVETAEPAVVAAHVSTPEPVEASVANGGEDGPA
jgi:hypothetical protein